MAVLRVARQTPGLMWGLAGLALLGGLLLALLIPHGCALWLRATPVTGPPPPGGLQPLHFADVCLKPNNHAGLRALAFLGGVILSLFIIRAARSRAN
jgi:hypothetical protein